MGIFNWKSEERTKIDLTPGSRFIVLDVKNEEPSYNVKDYTKYASLGKNEIAIEGFIKDSRVSHRIVGKDFKGTFNELMFNNSIVCTNSRDITKALDILYKEQTSKKVEYNGELQEVLTTINGSYTKAYYSKIQIKPAVKVKRLILIYDNEEEEIVVRSSKEYITKEATNTVLDVGEVYFLEDEGKTILACTFTGIYEYQIYSKSSLNYDNIITSKLERLRLL